MRFYIVAWKAYGEWKTSFPFRSEASAQDHINKFIATPDRDYNLHAQVIPIDVSEMTVHNPHEDFGRRQKDDETEAQAAREAGLTAATDAEAAASIK